MEFRRLTPPLTALMIAFAALALGMFGCAATSAGSEAKRMKRTKNSPQWKNGRFVNTLPRRDAGFWAMTMNWIKGAEHTSPSGPLPVIMRSAADFKEPPAGGLRVTWLGHSSIFLEIDSYRILIDPVTSERASPFSFVGPARFHPPPLPLVEMQKLRPHAVVISHDHYDHLDQPAIQGLKSTSIRCIVPLGVGAYLEEWGISPARITELDWWEETEIGDLKLTATPARHFSGRGIFMQDSTLWCGWAFQGKRQRVFFSGDTAMFPGFAEIGKRLGPFDVTMLDAGAYNAMWPDVHMGPEQAVQAHRMVRGRLLLPVHWGTFDLSPHSWIEPAERIIRAARKSGISIVLPRPGESFEPGSHVPTKRWWPAIPWRNAGQAPLISTGLGSGKK